MTMVELKEMCCQKNLKIGGSKQELIFRLTGVNPTTDFVNPIDVDNDNQPEPMVVDEDDEDAEEWSEDATGDTVYRVSQSSFSVEIITNIIIVE